MQALRTHVRQRPHNLPPIGLPRGLSIAVRRARSAEIQNLRLARILHQNVARLQVAVNDAPLMSMIHGLADFEHQLQPFAGVQMLRF